MTSGGYATVQKLACLELRGGNHVATYPAELPGLAAWVSCNPLRPSLRGGDLYYLSACSHGSVARVVIADVAGHGETVSEAAVHLRDALRHHIDYFDQSLLIQGLNESFLENAGKGKFATAFLASFSIDSGHLLYTNAGHLPPLWYRAGVKEWSFLPESTPQGEGISGLPLGLIAGTSYHQDALEVQPGDLLILYTDGINEAEDHTGEQLGLARLLSMAKSLPTGSATAAGEQLLARVAQFRGNAPPKDDATVVALMRKGTV